VGEAEKPEPCSKPISLFVSPGCSPAGPGPLPAPGTSALARRTLRISRAGPTGRAELGRGSGEPGWAEGTRQTLLAALLAQLQ